MCLSKENFKKVSNASSKEYWKVVNTFGGRHHFVNFFDTAGMEVGVCYEAHANRHIRNTGSPDYYKGFHAFVLKRDAIAYREFQGSAPKSELLNARYKSQLHVVKVRMDCIVASGIDLVSGYKSVVSRRQTILKVY